MATQADYPRSDEAAERYSAVRALSLALAEPLSDADATLQPNPEASPAKWHLAHTSWFFETFVLRDHVQGYSPFDDAYAYLFNSYYEGEGERHPRPRRGMLSRPSLDEIRAYRAAVDEALLRALPYLPPAALGLVELGLNHEQQHQELILTDMLAAFAESPLKPAIWPREPSKQIPSPPPLDGARRPGGIAEIGAPGGGFAFDCERPRHRTLLHPHEIADRPVANAEWLRFIEEGGYQAPSLWLSDGWEWVRANNVEAPLYWQRGDSAWLRFGLDGLHPVEPAEPVCHVSYYEADAFARWAGRHLPTEMEWEVAARAGQLNDAFGIVWQWTRSSYSPYPGYRAIEGALGEYNGKFMVNQLVLRGSSLATPVGHSRITYRNFFYPHHRWQFTGLRLADYA
jgi:ergothioneine biosynthesis protein EgtB